MQQFDGMIPSRRVLIEAEKSNAKNGHENLGFLSEKFGFLPINTPLKSLPDSHRIWDEIAAELPRLYERVSIRKTLEQMPRLDASPNSLDDLYLYRSATILGMFAHAYYWLELIPPKSIPEIIMEPWREVSTRLNKPSPFFSYSELVLYNWQFRQQNNQARCIENLSMLVQSVGKRDEEIFYLCMVEMVAVSTPVIGSVVRAQEAMVKNDIESLKKELVIIIECAELVNKAFSKIDLNPYSKTFVDPVTWGKCIGILLVPWDSYGVKGPSGTASPYFHLMDCILGRKQFASMHGQNQVHYKEVYNSIHVKNFLDAIDTISIKDFVEKSSDKVLRELYYQLAETYAGENGLLGIHQRKAYGYASTVFKIGRTETTAGSGTQCPFIDRVWNEIDLGLTQSREEREIGVGFDQPMAPFHSVSKCNKPNASMDIYQVVLNIQNTGISYKAGDRCGVLTKNNDDIVKKTLLALKATENDFIHINKTWREALQARSNITIVPEKILLRDFLKCARIRPLTRSVAEALQKLTASSTLQQIIDAHKEDQWELWDALALIADHYDVQRLWKSEAWYPENLSHIVPPEQFRVYSISSDNPDYLDLTVASLKYMTQYDDGVSKERFGTASNFIKNLAHEGNASTNLPVKIIRPTSFQLPLDENRPIIMFAGGSGISPFRSFIQHRLKQKNGGENWLFYGMKTAADLCYQQEIEEWVATGKLNVHLKFSNEDKSAVYRNGHFHFKKGSRGRISSLFEKKQIAEKMWALICPQEMGGQSASLYVCGSGLFFNSFFIGLKEFVGRFISDEFLAKEFIYSLVAEKRLMQDIFTTFSPAATAKNGYLMLDVSEIALHNNDENGFWIIIDDEVYDISEFLFLHPGGDDTLKGYAGIDATKEYKAVKHHLDSSVNAMLDIYKIGAVKKPNFGNIWGITIPEKTLDYFSLKQLYAKWLDYLYLVIEMQNTMPIEMAFYQKTIFDKKITPEKRHFTMQSVAKMLGDFMSFYFGGLIGEKLTTLWRISVGLCSSEEDLFFMDNMAQQIKNQPEYKNIIKQAFSMIKATDELQDFNITHCFNSICEINKHFVNALKLNILEGIKLFERYEKTTLEYASAQLVSILKRVDVILQSFIVELSQSLSTEN